MLRPAKNVLVSYPTLWELWSLQEIHSRFCLVQGCSYWVQTKIDNESNLTQYRRPVLGAQKEFATLSNEWFRLMGEVLLIPFQLIRSTAELDVQTKDVILHVYTRMAMYLSVLGICQSNKDNVCLSHRLEHRGRPPQASFLVQLL